MCLAIPARVEERLGDDARVRLGEARMRVSVVLTPEARVGDWVLVHAGFALKRISEADARETWMLAEVAGVGPVPPELAIQ